MLLIDKDAVQGSKRTHELSPLLQRDTIWVIPPSSTSNCRKPTIPHLTSLQKLVAALAAAAFAWVLWKQYLEGSSSGASWIFGILAITGLLILALRRPPRSLGSSRTAAKASSAGGEVRRPPKASISAMYSSARNLADKFFEASAKRVRDRDAVQLLNTNRAHLVGIFAYLGPKFVLNMKMKEFEQTLAATELKKTASDGFRAIEELEESAFRDMLPPGLFEMRTSPTEAAAFLSQDMLERFDEIFAECSNNLICSPSAPMAHI